jgi:hypothetical protein
MAQEETDIAQTGRIWDAPVAFVLLTRLPMGRGRSGLIRWSGWCWA